MKKLVVLSACIVFFLNACNDDDTYTGEGPIVTKELTLETFSAIEAMGSMNIVISQGSEQKVEVTGHANIIDRIETSVNNEVWEIKLKDGSYKNADLSFSIIIPELNAASMEGSGDIDINDFTSKENVFLRIIGSGDIQLDENTGCENLNMVIEGSGNINANGAFSDLVNVDIEIIGSGSSDGFVLEADQVEINIVGSADCSVTANATLKVTIDGSGSVRYKGEPVIESDISGSGKIINSN
ncbi:head GIN domain-containing protein [Lutimonas sp.]|uniref:head GIN domain-containing protein n=1 Tax=Lutimonas sp. TaxID=1872403 RepID=UPI003D9B4B43